ncbi:MAG: type IV secretion system protein [Pseudomonadota bacterium]
MLNFKELLSKKKTSVTENLPHANSDKVVSTISNWYSDRYNSVVIQRNLLLLLLIASVFMVIASSFIVGNISSTFKIQPFVIEVEDKTGLTDVVNPLSAPELTSNEVLTKFFLMQYIKAREGYNFQTWKYNYLTLVRLFSTPRVFGDFKRFINSNADSPLAMYGNNISTTVAFRSIQFFPPNFGQNGVPNDLQAVIRFTIFPENGDNLRGVTGNRIHKILTLTYKYQQTEMTEEDQSVNPLGFFITSYRADVENDSPPVVVKGQ